MTDDIRLLHNLLNDYADDIGLDPLSLDEAGRCHLKFDDTITVKLEYIEDTGALVMHTELGPLPAERQFELCRKMLEGNHFWRHTGGLGTLSLAPQEAPAAPATATLFYQTPIQSLDHGTFQNRLADFVDTAEAWIHYLQSYEQNSQTPVTDYLPETWLAGPMLRV